MCLLVPGAAVRDASARGASGRDASARGASTDFVLTPVESRTPAATAPVGPRNCLATGDAVGAVDRRTN